MSMKSEMQHTPLTSDGKLVSEKMYKIQFYPFFTLSTLCTILLSHHFFEKFYHYVQTTMFIIIIIFLIMKKKHFIFYG